jgi:hypothetical protein
LSGGDDVGIFGSRLAKHKVLPRFGPSSEVKIYFLLDCIDQSFRRTTWSGGGFGAARLPAGAVLHVVIAVERTTLVVGVVAPSCNAGSTL